VGTEPRTGAASSVVKLRVQTCRSSVIVSQRQTLDATDVADKPERHHAPHHLDILVSDLDAAVDHAISVGVSMAPVQPQQRVRVLFDPAGHPFCRFN